MEVQAVAGPAAVTGQDPTDDDPGVRLGWDTETPTTAESPAGPPRQRRSCVAAGKLSCRPHPPAVSSSCWRLSSPGNSDQRSPVVEDFEPQSGFRDQRGQRCHVASHPSPGRAEHGSKEARFHVKRRRLAGRPDPMSTASRRPRCYPHPLSTARRCFTWNTDRNPLSKQGSQVWPECRRACGYPWGQPLVRHDLRPLTRTRFG